MAVQHAEGQWKLLGLCSFPELRPRGQAVRFSMDISPAVVSVCERFDADNDLVLEHVNTFLDLSPNPCAQHWPEAMDSAAEFGHLNVVQWLHEHRQEGCTTDVMDMAASNGHLEIVQWLHDNRTEGCISNAIDFAAQHGHLKVVQWLHYNCKAEATYYAIDNAATYGHSKVIQWLNEHRDEGCSQSAVVNELNAGHEDTARWLVANRKSDDIGKMGFVEYLARRGHWDVATLTAKHPYL